MISSQTAPTPSKSMRAFPDSDDTIEAPINVGSNLPKEVPAAAGTDTALDRSDQMISTHDLSFSYDGKTNALKNISLQIPALQVDSFICSPVCGSD